MSSRGPHSEFSRRLKIHVGLLLLSTAGALMLLKQWQIVLQLFVLNFFARIVRELPISWLSISSESQRFCAVCKHVGISWQDAKELYNYGELEQKIGTVKSKQLRDCLEELRSSLPGFQLRMPMVSSILLNAYAICWIGKSTDLNEISLSAINPKRNPGHVFFCLALAILPRLAAIGLCFKDMSKACTKYIAKAFNAKLTPALSIVTILTRLEAIGLCFKDVLKACAKFIAKAFKVVTTPTQWPVTVNLRLTVILSVVGIFSTNIYYATITRTPDPKQQFSPQRTTALVLVHSFGVSLTIAQWSLSFVNCSLHRKSHELWLEVGHNQQASVNDDDDVTDVKEHFTLVSQAETSNEVFDDMESGLPLEPTNSVSSGGLITSAFVIDRVNSHEVSHAHSANEIPSRYASNKPSNDDHEVNLSNPPPPFRSDPCILEASNAESWFSRINKSNPSPLSTNSCTEPKQPALDPFSAAPPSLSASPRVLPMATTFNLHGIIK